MPRKKHPKRGAPPAPGRIFRKPGAKDFIKRIRYRHEKGESARSIAATTPGLNRRSVGHILTSPQYLKNLTKRKLEIGTQSLENAATATKIVGKHLKKIGKQKEALDPKGIRDIAWAAGAQAKQADLLIGSGMQDAELENDAELGALAKKVMERKLLERGLPDGHQTSQGARP